MAGRRAGVRGRGAAVFPPGKLPIGPVPRSDRGPGHRAAILDGEIVTLDRRSGAPRFQLLQRRLAVARPRAVLQASIPASLWIFDILNLDGADLTQLPYLQRRAILEDLPLGQSKAIAVPPVWPDLAGDVLLDVMRELSLEGVVMKRADSTYQPGRRSKSWIKSVLRRRTAVVVCGFIPSAAEPGGSLVVGAHNASGDLVFCGAVSSGLSRKARTALHARLSEIEAPHSPFTDMPSSAGVRWVQPSLIAVIDIANSTAGSAIPPSRAFCTPTRPSCRCPRSINSARPVSHRVFTARRA